MVRPFAMLGTLAMAALLVPKLTPAQQLAITMDDLPSHGPLSPGETRQDVARRILAAFQEAKVPEVYGFVNGVHVEQEPPTGEVLKMWRDAGYPLGNHTWSHPNLNSANPEQFEREVERNEPLLQRYMQGADWHWLRFPYLAEGDSPADRDAIRSYLAQHGYRIASVTMSFGDYAFNEPYARCRTKGDAAAARHLEDEYLQAARTVATQTRESYRAVLGREVPLVLLLHIGTLDAAMMPRLLRLYRDLGFQFTTLGNAERDPIYTTDHNPDLPYTPNQLQQAAAKRQVKLSPPVPLPNDLNTLCR